MGIFNRKKEEKSATYSGSAFFDGGIASGSERETKAYALEGYAWNPVVFRCVNEIAKAVSNLEFEVYKGSGDDEKVETEHEALALLAKPNPLQTRQSFLHAITSDRMYAGNAYIFKAVGGRNKAPKELWRLDPRKMEVEGSEKSYIPSKYIYTQGKTKVEYAVNQANGESDVKHIRSYNPTSNWYGLSPLSAGSVQADLHNSGSKWNFSLLRNGAKPSGLLKFNNSPNRDVAAKAVQWFKDTLTGSDNAGQVGVLTGGAEFQQMSMSPKDMDFKTSMEEATKYIAMVFGVPLPLVTTDASTFNNMDSAYEQFYMNTVLPIADEIVSALNEFLAPVLGEYKLRYNEEAIPALEGRRERMFNRMKGAVDSGIISRDEMRVETGYSARGGMADALLVQSSVMPIDFVDDIGDLESELKKNGYSSEKIASILKEEFGK